MHMQPLEPRRGSCRSECGRDTCGRDTASGRTGGAKARSSPSRSSSASCWRPPRPRPSTRSAAASPCACPTTPTWARVPTRAATRWPSAPPGGWPTAGGCSDGVLGGRGRGGQSRWQATRPQVGMLAQRLDACLLRRSCVAIHAARWYTLHAKPVHLLSLAAGRCRTTGGRAVMTWRTWRNGRSCLQTYGGRHLTNRSCCAGGSTRGVRRQPTRASRRDSVNALSYCLHVSRTSEMRESCGSLPPHWGSLPHTPARVCAPPRGHARGPAPGPRHRLFPTGLPQVRDTHRHTRGEF